MEVVSEATAPEARHTQLLMVVARLGTNPPPFVRDQTPAPSETEVAIESNLVLTVDDYPGDPNETDGVDLTTVTISIQIDGGGYAPAYTSSAFVAPYNGAGSVVIVAPDSTLGFKFTIDPTSDLPLNATIDIKVDATDKEGASSQTIYTFFTETSLVVTVVPAIVYNDGGYILEITAGGSGLPDGDYNVHVGPLGSVSDPICYSGVSGGGNVVALENNFCTVVSPVSLIGGPYAFTFFNLDTEVVDPTSIALTVVAHPVRNLVLAYRGLLPRDWATGYRTLDQWDYPQV